MILSAEARHADSGPLQERDKSEPTLVVPFCDFSLATHFLFSSDLTPGISGARGRWSLKGALICACAACRCC
jgi:hypothetical protein